MRDCLLILGMHRSGTSAMAGASAIAGASFGEHLVEAQEDNVRGYFEDRRVLSLHEEYLAAIGSSWDDIVLTRRPNRLGEAEFRGDLAGLLEEWANAPLPAVKDPRLSRLLDLWLPVLEKAGMAPRIVVIHRDQHEVAESLARRDGFAGEKSGLLWADHVLSAERSSRGFTRAFVSYDELLSDPVATLERVEQQLGVDWPRSLAESAAELRSFVTPELRHCRNEGPRRPLDLGRADRICTVIADLLTSADREPPPPESFDEAGDSLLRTFAEIDPLVIPHLLSVARRESEAALWLASKRLEGDFGARTEDLSAGLAASAQQRAAFEGRIEKIATQLEATSNAASEIAAELDRHATESTERARSVDQSLDYLLTEIRSLSEQLRALGANHLQRIGAVESRAGTLESRAGALESRVNRHESLIERLRSSLFGRLYRRFGGTSRRADSDS